MYTLSDIEEGTLNNLKENYKKNGIISIPHLVNEEQAYNLNKYLDGMKDEAWDISIHPYQNGVYTFNYSNSDFIKEGISSATNAMKRGEFSYLFYRRDKHSDSCGCCLCEFVKFLCSKEVLKFISDIIGKEVTNSISIFASCYKEGCFLTTHTDTGRGKIAFVYNITRDWDKSYGGHFELLNGDWRTAKETIFPKFNTLSIFCVEGDGVPHKVLPVTGTDKKRLAVSGWFI